MKSKFLLSVLILFAVCSCRSDVDLSEPGSDDLPLTRGQVVPMPEFDWENENYIQRGDEKIVLPWIAGANSTLSHDLLYDYKKADGWVMVYNDFPDKKDNNFFMLYNVPRGIMRVFYYADGLSVYPESLYFILKLSGSSSLLNNNSDRLSLTPNKNELMVPVVVDNGWTGFGNKKWAAADFNLSHYDAYDCYAELSVCAVNVSSIEMGGNITGDITGSFIATGNNVSSLMNINSLNVPINKTTNQTAVGGDYIAEQLEKVQKQNSGFFNSIWGAVSKNVKGAAVNGIADIAGKVATGAINWISSPLKGMLGSFIGGGSSTPTNYAVNLHANLGVQLTGTVTQRINPVTIKFNLPGIPAKLDGQYPQGIGRFGVWTIAQKPTVTLTTQRTLVRESGSYVSISHWGRITTTPVNLRLNPDLEGRYSITDHSVSLYFIPAPERKVYGYDPAHYDGSKYYYSFPGEKTAGNFYYDSYAPDLATYVHYPGDYKLVVAFDLTDNQTGNVTTHIKPIDFDFDLVTLKDIHQGTGPLLPEPAIPGW